ncbi:hypothetical protein [Vulcanisaeta souniana]|nr:hypothetical protein [Vulcanisaeta souniana]BDR92483.1 hypothetical protein Vsou_15760 [Vulcanisaeta souniana JCM 11219]
MLYLLISISGREEKFLDCDFELKPLTVIMGPPRSGKSMLLRLIFNMVYAALNKLTTTNDLVAMASNYLSGKLRDGSIMLSIVNIAEDELDEFKKNPDVRTWRDKGIFLTCSNVEEPNCKVEWGYNPFHDVILIPTDVEAILRYRFVPTMAEPYAHLSQYINDLVLRGVMRNEKMLKQLPFLSEAVEQLRVDKGRIMIIEHVAGATIDVAYSSSYVNILLTLEAFMLNEYIHEGSLVLIDNIDSYLHPAMGQDKLALMLWAMVNNGVTVVLSTHDLIFLDTLRHIRIKDYNANVYKDWSEMSIVVPKPWQGCVIQSPLTSDIETYNVYRLYEKTAL